MEKLSLFLVVCLLFVCTNAHATSLISISGNDNIITLNIDGESASVTVADLSSSSDSWKDDYSGYTGDTYSGYYIGTITLIDGKSANDDESVIEALISYYLGESFEITSSDSDKVDSPSTSSDFLSIVYSSDNKSGTWSTIGESDDSDDDPWVYFYTVKAGTEFALYYLDPAEQSGTWTTIHILNKGGQTPTISHFTGIFGPEPEIVNKASENPEPATMMLFGFGLLGVAGISRKNFFGK